MSKLADIWDRLAVNGQPGQPDAPGSFTIYGQPVRGRACGSCKLCCTLLPVELAPGEWVKAGERCRHLCSKGCGIYPKRPAPCQYWSCRWLFDGDTAELRRPDHSHYVIDSMPDNIRITDNDTGEARDVQVLQVWVDPAFRESWRDPRLLAYMARLGIEQRMATVIRFSQSDVLTVFPPSMTVDGEWHEKTGSINNDVGLYGRRPPP